ncbi:hypothetical protein DL765_007816 [Monosporascus sp. GIB2]|nr:hypothetical protein DL765_007816 [Monosporascus sp. GIB2]
MGYDPVSALISPLTEGGTRLLASESGQPVHLGPGHLRRRSDSDVYEGRKVRADTEPLAQGVPRSLLGDPGTGL